MKYDYLVVGAGFMAPYLLTRQQQGGKEFWLSINVRILPEMFIRRTLRESMCTSMVHIFSIPTIKRCGITLQNLRN